jgi:hypothetical protein
VGGLDRREQEGRMTVFTIETLSALSARLFERRCITNPARHDMEVDCRLAARALSNFATLRFRIGEMAERPLRSRARLSAVTCSTPRRMPNFEEAAVTFHDFTAYEREALHLLAGIRSTCWLMATAVAGGAMPVVILALLGY